MNSEPYSGEYLSCDEAAKVLNVSRRTLNRWGRLRKGPPRIKVGRTVYYRWVSIELWLISLEANAGGLATVAARAR